MSNLSIVEHLKEGRIHSFRELIAYFTLQELYELLEVDFGGLNLLLKYPEQIRSGQAFRLAEFLGANELDLVEVLLGRKLNDQPSSINTTNKY